MRWMIFRLWRIGIADYTDGTVQSGNLVWRRWRWRIWTADVLPYWRSSTRKWATWRLGQFLADAAIRRDGVLAACEAMHTLNRAAKHGGQENYEIYAIKRRLIGELLEAYPCRITRHVQEQACYSCEGTGIWSRWASYADTCWKCRGTGVYRRTELFLFTFSIDGRVYRWHQPADFWPVLKVRAAAEKYVPDRQKYVYVGEGLRYETLIETVARWVDVQGLALNPIRTRARGYHFWRCVRADLRRYTQGVRHATAKRLERVRRWIEQRRARVIIPSIGPSYGHGSVADRSDDDLPF